jgi:hypothetical protein
MITSPYLTLAEAAAYARKGYRTIHRHCRLYETSHGRTGLKNQQATPRGKRLVHVDDLNRWIEGAAPSRGRRRLEVA